MFSNPTVAYASGRVPGNMLLRVEIREAVGAHQVALLDYRAAKGTLTYVPDELEPLTVRWGDRVASPRTLYGYVNHVEEFMSPDGIITLRVMVIGASRPLNSVSPASWTSLTASAIVKQIAAKHRMRLVLHATRGVLPYVATETHSDFLALANLASKSGSVCWADGSTLYFLDPARLLSQRASRNVHVYTRDGARRDTLYGVQAIRGSLAPGNATNTTVFGIDRPGQLFKATGTGAFADIGATPPVGQSVHRDVVTSLGDARRITQDSASQSWSTANATLIGDGRARLGSLVGLFGNLVTPGNTGVWLCVGAIHVMEYNVQTHLFDSTCDVELTRNSIGSIETTDSHSSLSALFKDVPSVLKGRMWESSTLEQIYG